MWAGGAPRSYLIGNGAALGLAVILGLLPSPLRISERIASLTAIGLSLLLLLPLLAGPEVDGVRRWIALGPVKLHAGMLLIPAMLVTMLRASPNANLLALLIAAFGAFLQPDKASAVALLFGTACLFWLLRQKPLAIVLSAQLVIFGGLFFMTDGPEAVPFVEQVIVRAWMEMPGLSVAMAFALVAAIVIPSSKNHGLLPPMGASAGFAMASLLGPYPSPLIGYGAAPILGYGLALLLAKSVGTPPMSTLVSE